MSEGPKRFSLSDYQSKRGATKPLGAVVSTNEQKSELEELHMLLGTGTNGSHADMHATSDVDDAEFLRTPGASPNNGEGRASVDANGNASEEGEDVEMDGRGVSRSDKRDSRDGRGSRRRHRRRGRRSRSQSKSASRSRSRSRSPPPSSRRRRSRAHSASRSRSRDNGRRSRSRSHRRRGNRDRDRSASASKDKISMRCVFPYEDGGIIIGLRGAHLSKLRKSVPSVDWRISNETNDRQDRILVVRGTVKDIAEAFKALAEHFISQGMHVDYPQQTRGRGTKEVDTGKPFIPIRLLMPHKTCGAIIGQKSETLINTRVNCAARRVYVYRERISESRERVVEVVGTPGSIARVMEVLGGQVSRTLNGDQQESELYTPERDGLRKFLSKQGVPRSRVSLEPIKGGEKNGSAGGSRKGASRKRSRSRSVSSSDESDASGRSQSRGRGRHARSSRRSRRSRSRSYSRSRSRSPGAKSHRSSRRSRRSRHRGHEKKSSRGHRNRSRSRSSGRSSASDSRSRSRSRSSSYSRSRSHSRSRSRSRSKSRRKTGSGNRRAADSHRRRRSSRAKDRRQSTGDKDDLVHEASDAEMYDANVGDQGADSGGERAMRTSGWENGDLSVDAWAVTNDEASDKMSGGALKDGGSW